VREESTRRDFAKKTFRRKLKCSSDPNAGRDEAAELLDMSWPSESKGSIKLAKRGGEELHCEIFKFASTWSLRYHENPCTNLQSAYRHLKNITMPPRRVVSRSNAPNPSTSNSSSTLTSQSPSVPAPVVAVKEAAEEISNGFSASVQELWKGYQRESTSLPSPSEKRGALPSAGCLILTNSLSSVYSYKSA